MSNDQRPKKMAVYSGDAPKAPSTAAAQVTGTSGAADATSVDAAGGAVAADSMGALQHAAAPGSGLPIWAILLYLVAGTGAGAAIVALLPRFAPQLLHSA